MFRSVALIENNSCSVGRCGKLLWDHGAWGSGFNDNTPLSSFFQCKVYLPPKETCCLPREGKPMHLKSYLVWPFTSLGVLFVPQSVCSSVSRSVSQSVCLSHIYTNMHKRHSKSYYSVILFHVFHMLLEKNSCHTCECIRAVNVWPFPIFNQVLVFQFGFSEVLVTLCRHSVARLEESDRTLIELPLWKLYLG